MPPQSNHFAEVCHLSQTTSRRCATSVKALRVVYASPHKMCFGYWDSDNKREYCSEYVLRAGIYVQKGSQAEDAILSGTLVLRLVEY